MMHFPSYKSALSQQGHACNTHSCRSPKMLSALAIILQSFVCVSAHLPCNFHPVSHAPECVRHRVLWARVMTERTRMRMPCHGIALHRKLHPMRPDTAAVTGCQGHWITTAFLFTHPVPKKDVQSKDNVRESGLCYQLRCHGQLAVGRAVAAHPDWASEHVEAYCGTCRI